MPVTIRGFTPVRCWPGARGRRLSLLSLALLFATLQLSSAAAVTQAQTTVSALDQPSGTTNPCTLNVPEAAAYSLVYRLNIPVNSNFNLNAVPYAVNNAASTGRFRRIGYCLELDQKWIWVSMDDFTNGVIARAGVPVKSVNTGGLQQTVSNMNVDSNMPGITRGSSIATGNIEFWNDCYDPPTSLDINGSSTLYDFDDTRKTDGTCEGYGSMQVHNYGRQQTLWAYNAWDNNVRGNVDLGIGNSGGAQPDWTFAHNGADYGDRTLSIYVAQDVITTVAGNKTSGHSGDGGPATSASLFLPKGMAVDGHGNLFIADTANNRIRKVLANGHISTVAGDGQAGNGGDNGPAIRASLDLPQGVAVDAAGTIYIADTNNHRIRKVGLDGVMTTVVGARGKAKFDGDGGLGRSASVNGPAGLAVDALGNLYIADQFNHRIRKLDTNNQISTVAGNGTNGYSGDEGPATGASLSGPAGVAVDALGNLYIADQWNHRVRKVDEDGLISTVAGNGTPAYSGDGGPATGAGLNSPTGVALDALGNLYIADQSNHRIRRVADMGIISTVAGNGTQGGWGNGGPATIAALSQPRGVAVDLVGNLYIVDTGNSQIRAMAAPSDKGDSSPTARDDDALTDEDRTVTVNVLDNDMGADGGSGNLTLDKIGTAPGNGSATIIGRAIHYTPKANWSGEDSFSYGVRNAQNQQSKATVRVTVYPVNDLPTRINLSSSVIDPELPLTTPIGTFSTDDVDTGDSHTYRLSGPDAAYFSVAGSVLRRAAFYDPDRRSRYLVQVTSTDRAGGQQSHEFAVTVKRPSSGSVSRLQLSKDRVAENEAVGTLVGTLQATDSENRPLTFSLTNGRGDDNNGLFQVVGNQLKTAAVLDYEALRMARIRVQVSNGRDAPLQEPMLVYLNDDPKDPRPGLTKCSGQDINLIKSNDGQTEVTVRQVKVSERSDKGCVVNGKLFVRIPGNSTAANVDFQGRVDQENELQSKDELVGDAIADFTLDPAGPTLKLGKAIIEYYGGRPSLRVKSPSICLPEDLGGLCSTLSGITLLIDSTGLNFGGGSDQGDKAVQNLLGGLSFSKKGFGISDITGKYQRVANGYEISAAGTFSIPRLSSGKAGCGIAVGLTIGKDSAGQLSIAIQPLSADARGLRLSELTLGLSCDPGIPIAQTGLYLTEVSGTVSLRPGDTYVKLSLTVVTLKKISDIALAQAQGSATVLIEPEWGLDLGVQLELLSAIEVAKAEASIRKDRFSTRFSFQALVIGGDAGVDIWTANTKLHFTGRGTVGVRAPSGSIYKKCIVLCLSIPPSDIEVGGIGADIGEFTNGASNGKFGLKGFARVLGRQYGFFVDHHGKLSFGGVSEYVLATPPGLLAAAAGAGPSAGMVQIDPAHTDHRYTFLSDRDVIIGVPDRAVALTATAGISLAHLADTTNLLSSLSAESGLTMTLLAPNGLEITPDNYNQPPVKDSYDVQYFSQVVQGPPQERIFTQYSVGNAVAGDWRIKLHGDLESNRYLLAVNGLARPTVLSEVTVDAANLKQAKVNWALTSDYAPVKVTAYLSPEPVSVTRTYTDTQSGLPVQQVEPNYTGFAVGEFTLTDAADLKGRATTRTLDLSSVPSGSYHLWLRADNAELPPASAFASGVGASEPVMIRIDQASTFPATWNAAITPRLDANLDAVDLIWEPLTHPDIDFYRAHLGVKPGEYREVSTEVVPTVERDQNGDAVGPPVGRIHFGAMQPAQDYFVVLEAVDEESGRTVRSQELHFAFDAGDYRLTTPQQRYQLSPGTPLMIPLSLEVTSPLFFENVSLGLDSAGLPPGIIVTFADAPDGPPTLTPAQSSRVMVVDVADTLPEGVYTFTIHGYNAQQLDRSRTITLVNGQASPVNRIFLPTLSRQAPSAVGLARRYWVKAQEWAH